MRTVSILIALMLAGCVRSISHVASLPPFEEFQSAKSDAELLDCIIMEQQRGLIVPIQSERDGAKTLAMQSPSYGIFVHYTFTKTNEGTHVLVRRRNVPGDRYDRVRSCFN